MRPQSRPCRWLRVEGLSGRYEPEAIVIFDYPRQDRRSQRLRGGEKSTAMSLDGFNREFA